MVSSSVDDGYTCVINPGTILEFDADVGLWSSGVLDVNGVQGNMVVLRGFQGAAWGGIDFGGAGAHASQIEFAEIRDAEWDGISVDATWISAIDHCSIHNNGRAGILIWSNDGPTTITNSEIFSNEQYGIYVGIDWADDFPVTIGGAGVGNHIHHNGVDGLYSISNSIISEGNHYEENTRYGAYVGFDWGDENSSFTNDLLDWNGCGLSFNNIWV